MNEKTIEVPYYFKLKGKKVVACKDMMEWAQWYEKANRTIRRTILRGSGNIDDPTTVLISTVFLGMSHFGDLFETMIFGVNSSDQYMQRYRTYDEAVKGHEELEKLLVID